jgi:hypothetical protein
MTLVVPPFACSQQQQGGWLWFGRREQRVHAQDCCTRARDTLSSLRDNAFEGIIPSLIRIMIGLASHDSNPTTAPLYAAGANVKISTRFSA